MKSLRDLESFFISLKHWKGWEGYRDWKGNSQEVVNAIAGYERIQGNDDLDLPSEFEAHQFLRQISAQMDDLVTDSGFEGWVSIDSIVWTISSSIASQKLSIPVEPLLQDAVGLSDPEGNRTETQTLESVVERPSRGELWARFAAAALPMLIKTYEDSPGEAAFRLVGGFAALAADELLKQYDERFGAIQDASHPAP